MRLAFFQSNGLYDVMIYFTQQLAAALERQGIQCEIYNALDGGLREYIVNLDDPPDITCAITGKCCCNYNVFIEMTGIPHFSFCIDAPVYFFERLRNRHNVLSFVDRSGFELIPPDSKAFFLPQGTDANLALREKRKPKFDVLLIGACFDFEAIRKRWQEELSQPLKEVMEKALEQLFAENSPSFAKALLEQLEEKGIAFCDVDLWSMCRDLENYIRGKDRFELLKSIKDAPITIFGPHRFGDKKWNDYIGIFPNVTIVEGEISFKNSFDLIEQSRLFLNSAPSLKDGAHERVFNGFLLNSLVLTNETPYYKEFFEDQNSILFYKPGRWQEVNGKVNYFLAHEEKREQLVKKGKEIVLQHHTWDVRASQLATQLKNYVFGKKN